MTPPWLERGYLPLQSLSLVPWWSRLRRLARSSRRSRLYCPSSFANDKHKSRCATRKAGSWWPSYSGLFSINYGLLWGIVAWYSGELAFQDFTASQARLHRAPYEVPCWFSVVCHSGPAAYPMPSLLLGIGVKVATQPILRWGSTRESLSSAMDWSRF